MSTSTYSMDYLNSIQCRKEPFAAVTGEDTFLSQPLRESFEKLTHSIRLGAGLHIVDCSDGTGKTTLIRQLSEKFTGDANTIVLSILTPQFTNLQQFLTTLAGAFKTIKPPSGVEDKKLQKAFNNFFHKQCLQEKKTVLLLLDNGETLPEFCLQALDDLYAHHVDSRRLLQTVICGAAPLQKKLKSIESLSSRIVFSINLKSFSFKETKNLIQFHLERAAINPEAPPSLFSNSSQWLIYRLTQGDPKKIIDFCQFIVLTLIIEKRKKADWFMTLRCAKNLMPKRAKKLQLIRVGSLSSLIGLMLVFGLWSEQIKDLTVPQIPQPAKPPVAQKLPAPKAQTKEQGTVAPETVQQEVEQEVTAPEALQQEVEQEVTAPEAVQQEIAQEATAPEGVQQEIAQEATAPEGVQQEIAQEAVSPEPLEESEPALTLPPDEPVVAVKPPDEIAAVSAEPVTDESAIAKIPAAIEPPVEHVATFPEPVEEITTIVTPAIRERRDVMPGDTFLVMIQKVYGPGHLKPHFIEQVIAANPQLKNPDNLVVGDEVFFPVLSAKGKEPVTIAKKSKPQIAKKTESLVTKKLDRVLQPVDSPDLIGKLSVQPGDTLGGLIRGIYGPFSFNPEYTAKVLAVNSHLKNPDRLEVGETLFFPDMPITPEIGIAEKPSQVASRGAIPDFLGDIITFEDETFGEMIRRIYGPYSYNRENKKKVLALNPNLKNPDLLSVGQKIRFPSILVTLTPEAADVWWVKVITLDNLQNAYRFLRVYSKWTPPMLIIPSRNDNGQVLFNLLLQSYFTEEISAQAAINELPVSITANAKPLHGLNPNTYYYWTKQKN